MSAVEASPETTRGSIQRDKRRVGRGIYQIPECENTQDKRRLCRPLHPLVLSRVAYFGQIA